ncbi:hypothetical protein PENSPDRAFT_754467 [Peniophora sp. CONT]|nr:hypothetical protein PENSPDRAFT_754467 [Peniophora sp. CONT]
MPFVVSLPDDVLHIVFCWLSIIDVPGLYLQSSADKTFCEHKLGWITASHVCRRWRALVLRMPLLWARIAGGVFASENVCETIIERAKDVPLHFWGWNLWQEGVRKCPADYYKMADARGTGSRLASQYLPRLEKLALYVGDDDDEIGSFADVGILTGQPLSQLKEMYMECRYFKQCIDLGFDAPELVTVHLRRIFLPIRIPSLRHLRIDFHRDECIPLKMLLDALGCSPSLEELELDHVLNHYSKGPSLPDSYQPVQLPRLALLQFEGKWASFSPFWRAIEVPSAVAMTLGISRTKLSEIAAFRHLHQLLAHPNKNALRLTFFENNSEQLEMHVFDSTAATHYYTASGERCRTGVYICIRNMFSWSSEHPHDFVHALLTSLITQNIRSLDLDLFFDYCSISGPRSMQSVLQQLTDITTVSVGRNSDIQLLKSLLCPIEGPSVAPLFPRLRSLVLKHPRVTAPYTSRIYPDIKDHWEALIQLCSALSDLHCPLKSIHTVRFNIHERHSANEPHEINDAVRAQEEWIDRVRELVNELVVVNPDD